MKKFSYAFICGKGYFFPPLGGEQLFVYSLMMREAHRSIRRLETAAKRRKGAGNDVSCRGMGQSPIVSRYFSRRKGQLASSSVMSRWDTLTG